jgi:PPM family protein phosphatase
MIPSEKAHLQIAASTHPGMSGKNNEDRYSVSAYLLEGANPRRAVLAIVADGIGGHRAGEVAAGMAVERINQAVANSDGSQPVQTLVQAIRQASQDIWIAAENEPERRGMGATCACVLVIEENLYIAYVGDSRIYLQRNGAIQHISTDHTWVQEAIDAGLLTPEQARLHPNAHVIRRHLGSQQPVEVDTRLRLILTETSEQSQANQGLPLQPGDQVLLCSDGLTDLVKNEEISAALQNRDQNQALETLTTLANQRGGHDNITIVTLRMPLEVPPTLIVPRQPRPPVTAAPRRRPVLWWLVLGGLLGLLFLGVVGGLAGFFLLRSYVAQNTPVAPVASGTLLPSQGQPAEALTPSPLNPAAGQPTRSSGPPRTPGPTLTSPPVTYYPTSTRGP